MKQALLLSSAIFFCIFKLTAQQIGLAVDGPPKLPIAELATTDNAANYLNQKVTLKGLLYDFEFLNNSKTTVLYLNGNFPNQSVAIIIQDNTSSFVKNAEVRIRGNYTTVTGVVTKFRGKPAIKVSNWNDVGFSDAFYKIPLPFDAQNPARKYYKPLAQYAVDKVNDTVDYVFDNFLFHQNLYRDKPLNVLLDQIVLPVKNWLFVNTENKAALNLEFDGGDMVHKTTFTRMPAILRIFFKQPQAEKTLIPDSGAYTKSVRQYYGKQIIDSIDYWSFPRKVKLPKATGY
jgi:hypothetical protein